MPIYEYKCSNCGHQFAMLEPLGTSEEGRECPKCGSTRTQRTISTFAPIKSPERGSSCRPTGGG